MSELMLAVALDLLLGEPPSRFHPVCVTLEKRGQYRLGDGPPPDVAVVDRAVGVFVAAAGMALVAGLVLFRAFRWRRAHQM